MKRANPEKVNDPQAILIGLTKQDMYIGQYDWRFGFSYLEQGKYAVVSSGRMNLGWRNQLASEDQISDETAEDGNEDYRRPLLSSRAKR